MSEIYSCNYPIWHTFSADEGKAIDYTIHLESAESDPIYAGRVYPASATEEELAIDISEICREYFEAFYEDIEKIWTNGEKVVTDYLPRKGNVGTIAAFVVDSESNPTAWAINDDTAQEEYKYPVIYNYNTDYKSYYDGSENLNAPILREADPRQKLFMCGYRLDGEGPDVVGGTIDFAVYINGEKQGEGSGRSSAYQVFMVDLAEFPQLKEGDRVRLVQVHAGNGTAVFEKAWEYEIAAGCRNRFVLYYVNKLGGGNGRVALFGQSGGVLPSVAHGCNAF